MNANTETVKFYLAPMEGLTGYIYRNALEKYYPGTDRFFTPFIAPNQKMHLRSRVLRDILPENNRVKNLIPQILTNNAEYFLNAASALHDLGYEEVNLNLGCPSATVAAKGRGSGFLAYPHELDAFLENIFSKSPVAISIKTRIGLDDTSGAFHLMEIYKKYPLSELIIHPRTQKDFYRGKADRKIFGELAAIYGNTADICYNGDIFTESDFCSFKEQYPQIRAVMLGRGIIANPGLIGQIRTGKCTDKKTLRAFHDEVLEGYRTAFSSDRNAMFRMKEIWVYLIHLFNDFEKYKKKIQKAQSLPDYISAVNALFSQQELMPQGPKEWTLPQK